MHQSMTLYSSTVGKKAVMAVSGVILIGFVLGHMAGNLNAYFGSEAFNAYARALHSMPALVWLVRLVLVLCVIAHVGAALELWQRNRSARPTPYARPRVDLATYYAAKTMTWTGPILVFFIAYHLAHLTFGWTGGLYTFDPANPYNNLVYGFQNWVVAGLYIVGNLALGVHLFHGAWSLFQSVGANHPRYNRLRRHFAIVVAVSITMGNLSFPIAVLTGLIVPSGNANLPLPH